MSYLVARASGANKNDVIFHQVGCSTGSEVKPQRTKFTGLYDADGHPIHRQAEPRQRMGFHCA